MSAEPNLRVAAGAEERVHLADLFHRINRLMPVDQQIVSVAPDTTVREALEKMREHSFSQLPVVEGREVLGLFSYRSLAAKLVEVDPKKHNPVEILVEEAMEIVDASSFVHINHEFRSIFDTLDMEDFVLVGEAGRLQGIVTAMDVLRYLYGVASPFMLIAEIELCVRALMRQAMSDEAIAEAAAVALTGYEKPENRPTQLEEMTFNDYVQIVGDGRCWDKFRPVFGGNRDRTRARLKVVGELRNEVFHFRRELTVEEHQTLSDARSWLLMRSRAV
ncbi:MAG: CBS domain-containing protein, partial [Dehalococcoidia bacterium]